MLFRSAYRWVLPGYRRVVRGSQVAASDVGTSWHGLCLLVMNPCVAWATFFCLTLFFGHSYQCIIQRSRLVEQLAHHRLYDTKRSYRNSYNEKDTKDIQRSHTQHYNKRKPNMLSNTTRSKIWPKRPTDKHSQPASSMTSQAATWEPQTTRRYPRRTHLSAR